MGVLIKVRLDSPPLFKEGSKSYAKLIGKNIKYPGYASKNGIHGKVVIALLIDSLGKCISRKVAISVDTSCDNEALRVIKLIPDNWYPGVFNSKKVTSQKLIPINFLND
jgi:periplasmic protein TonB